MSITRAQFEAQIKTIEQSKIGNINTQLTTGAQTPAQALVAQETVKQQALMVQRDLLRDSGDRSPF